MRTHYRFESRWSLPWQADLVVELLADVEGYPTWWPQVRAVEPVDDDSARVVVRSLLPYTLDLVLTRAREDREAGVLEANVAGPLEGWSRWTVEEGYAGTRVRYEQEVHVRARLLRVGSAAARPVLVANHAAMMRGARRGLLRRGPGPAGRSPR